MNKKQSILILVLSLFFISILLLVIFKKTAFIDEPIYEFIISWRSSFLDTFFIFITQLGNTIPILLIVLMMAAFLHNRYGIFLMVSTIDSVLMNTLVKYCVQRPRPTGLRLIEQGGYSFPSGHAMISVCVYGYLLYLAYTRISNKYLKYSVSILLLLVILGIGVSRIYVGVHYPTDVLAGYLLATIYVILLVEVTKNMNFRGN